MAIYAQASDRRDQGPSPDGVADDYAAADGGYFAAGHTTASVDAWVLGIEKSAVLVGVWEDHGVGVDLEFDSSKNYAESHRSAAVQVAGAPGLSRTEARMDRNPAVVFFPPLQCKDWTLAAVEGRGGK